MVTGIVKNDITNDTVDEFILELLDRLCDGLHITADDGRDIREESNADEYDWADGEIADLVEQFFGFTNAERSKYKVERIE